MADIYNEVKQKMMKCLDSLKENLNTLRTGRASAALLDNVKCDYYGEMTPVNQIATIKIPEPRQLQIIPYDKNDLKSIVAALNASNLGITPTVDTDCIRLIMPSPTEERRVELTKKAKAYGEETKVAVRNIRRDSLDALKKQDGISEDLVKRSEADVQKATDEVTLEIDKLVKTKSDEIMSV